jgi:hypothetical protein
MVLFRSDIFFGEKKKHRLDTGAGTPRADISQMANIAASHRSSAVEIKQGQADGQTLHLWQSCACAGVGNIPNLQQWPARPRTSGSLLFWRLCWQGPEPGAANPRHWQAPAAWGLCLGSGLPCLGACALLAGFGMPATSIHSTFIRPFIIHYPVLKLTSNGTKAGGGLRRRQPLSTSISLPGIPGKPSRLWWLC